jgi:hypothetical protein
MYYSRRLIGKPAFEISNHKCENKGKVSQNNKAGYLALYLFKISSIR